MEGARMVEQGTNLNDFLLLLPCCGALLIMALLVGGVLLLTQVMKAPEPSPAGDES